jgi:hypothetical protein
MPEILRPTPRPSSTESLLDLYKNIRTSQPSGIRSHLTRNTINSMAWGLGKQAGAPNYMTTRRNADTQYERTFQPSQFLVYAPLRVTSFNGYSLRYAQNAYNHDNRNYY